MSHRPKGLLDRMGPDGLLMLAASMVVAVMTGGVSLVWAIMVVGRRAAVAAVDVDDVAVITIFGMRLVGDEPGGDYRLRLERGVTLARSHPSAPVVLLGGYTGGSISEAEAGRRYLMERGVDAERIVVEERSTHSLENLREARAMLREGEGEVAAVSNRYHLPRIVTLAEGLGMRVTPVAAEERLGASSWCRLLLEGVFLHWYHTGRIVSHAIGSKHMIDRIT